jgi:hypothetical protein
MWDDKANDMIDMAFAKKRVDDRKLWLLALEPGCHINYDVDRISYDDFINKELILFSHAGKPNRNFLILLCIFIISTMSAIYILLPLC